MAGFVLLAGVAAYADGDRVEARLHADRNVCHVGDSLEFTRSVHNSGERPIHVYPFRYMNDNLRFFWLDPHTLKTWRYGDGKLGHAPKIAVPVGARKVERLRDNVVTKREGTYYVFISCGLPESEDRLLSNVIKIEVLPKAPGTEKR